ncbi:DUF3299 domain-containing protein [Cupriavidus sp. CV2]|uniref:DUF3299 domain-containing protein n=1 Tax=Cupriavidus ulmosensis TaxID=3065913 RepID=UPI00296AF025|nr:DUF3299 domain-containing protein [Cupriavidus sp. CV2]MDW3687220.1 DUF3299 domain-containing protein [Cupriavidus sp. CV2]
MAPRVRRTLFVLTVIGVAIAGAAYFFRPLPPPQAKAGSATAKPPAYAIGEALQPAPAAPDPALREIDWQALLPKGWDPLAPFKGLKLDALEDGDPRAQIALYRARQYWKNAPVESRIDGAAVRIAGFVVSLDGEGEAIREFLLVPYFGACIHVPPPPANQVIHVRTDKPLAGLRTMDTVWISGAMRVERADTMMGHAGYAMPAARVEPYLPPSRH